MQIITLQIDFMTPWRVVTHNMKNRSRHQVPYAAGEQMVRDWVEVKGGGCGLGRAHGVGALRGWEGRPF